MGNITNALSTISKITCPVLTECYPRKRLFHLLDRCRKRPILWVSGPPGSGKTTLVLSYLKAREVPFICYHVDERDADIAMFFYYMDLAVQSKSPRRRKSLPLPTSRVLPDLPAFTQQYFENLYGRLKTPFALVFDDYH